MGDDWLVWAIIGAFYLPLHALPPLAVAWLRGGEQSQRQQRLRRVLIEVLLSMAVAFALVFWLAAEHLQWAMAALAVSLLPPWWRALR